jgi:hypothetical protein
MTVKKLLVVLVGVVVVGMLVNSPKREREHTLASAANDPAAYVAANFTPEQQEILKNYAKLDDMSLPMLHRLATRGHAEFHLTRPQATAFALEIGALATKAGKVGEADSALKSFLNLGAARGLTAQETLEAVRQINESPAAYKRAIGE